MAFSGSKNRQKIRNLWNSYSDDWINEQDLAALFDEMRGNPGCVFHHEVFPDLETLLGDLPQKVCVPASGDNFAVFALSLMGHDVTSVDISKRQIEKATSTALAQRLAVEFVVSDVLDMASLANETFDLVYTSNGVLTWIDDLPGMFGEIKRILKAGGSYLLYDVHPFQRPWEDRERSLVLEKPYRDIGPIRTRRNEDAETFHWRMQDILNGLTKGGLAIQWIRELESGPTENTGYFWGHEIKPELNDWRRNPLAALPAWLEVAARKLAAQRPD